MSTESIQAMIHAVTAMIQSLLYAIAAMIEMILDPIAVTAHKKTQAYKALENFASSLNESDNLDNGLTG